MWNNAYTIFVTRFFIVHLGVSMKTANKLPIGVQSFEILRQENYIYVDKTELLYKLVQEGRVYFLSRPRRFGKSLLMSTLDAIFQAKKHLFEGLWIEKSDYVWKKYPVIYLDMSTIPNGSSALLIDYLTQRLVKIAEEYGVSLNPKLEPSTALQVLIESLAKNNSNVVVLVDEYDKPLLDQINNVEVALQHRDTLKQFYGILKSQDQNLRFVMLTGVSKFSKVSVFSGLNNPNDISLASNYAALLGYTQQELEHYFEPWIEPLARKEDLSKPVLLAKIKHWYNGYRFSDANVKVYNPFSTLLLFDHQKFTTHWFATGTPTFLINLIDERKFDVTVLERLEVQESTFTVYEVDQLEILPLLYQTGYLTIQDYDNEYRSYTLGYPNFEVEQAFVNSLLARFTQVEKSEQDVYLFRLVKLLKRIEFEEFFSTLNQYLTQIPYELHMKKELYYQNIFYLLLTLVGLTMDAEVHTNRGRIDAVIELKDRVYIFEFKLDKTAQAALDQIKQRGYAEKYIHMKKTLYLLGVNFSTEKRNIESWLLETM
jgi:hypothetical protein